MTVQSLKAGVELTLLVVVIFAVYMFFNSDVVNAAKKAVSTVADLERDLNPI
jgi:hypothetical protein